MKKLSNLKGAKTLSKQEQKSINGGLRCDDNCPNYMPYCCGGYCSRVPCHEQ